MSFFSFLFSFWVCVCSLAPVFACAFGAKSMNDCELNIWQIFTLPKTARVSDLHSGGLHHRVTLMAQDQAKEEPSFSKFTSG